MPPIASLLGLIVAAAGTVPPAGPPRDAALPPSPPAAAVAAAQPAAYAAAGSRPMAISPPAAALPPGRRRAQRQPPSPPRDAAVGQSQSPRLAHDAAAHGLSALVTVGSSLAVVLGLFFLVAWAHAQGRAARLGRPARRGLRGPGPRPLGARQQVHLLRCGSKLLLVSITPAGAETLDRGHRAAGGRSPGRPLPPGPSAKRHGRLPADLSAIGPALGPAAPDQPSWSRSCLPQRAAQAECARERRCAGCECDELDRWRADRCSELRSAATPGRPLPAGRRA